MSSSEKSLLAKYMLHVFQCEGIDFTDRLNEGMQPYVKFTDDETAVLLEISATIASNPWPDSE